jgi:hypothetical protein
MLLVAALLPFVAVAPDHWGFELRGGLADVHSGKRALHIVMESGATTEIAHQPFGVHPEQPLSATAWHKGDGLEVRLLLRFLDAQGRILSTTAGEPSRTDSHWRRLAIAARSPAAAERMSLILQVTGQGHATFDDVSVAGLSNGGFEEGLVDWDPPREGAGAAWVNDSPFVPWGFNYDRTRYQGKDLIWEEAPFAKIEHDFRAARRLGANVIRLFLQMSRFMPRYQEMDPAALDQLDHVVQLARRYDLRLDLTGLSHIAGLPEWFGSRTSQEIQRAEQLFWETLARRYAGEPAIFAFDLQNEPFVGAPDHDLKPAGCFTMTANRQFCYVNIHRVLPGMSRQETARQWTTAMVEAIHKQDPRRLVTIGLVAIAAPVMGEFDPGFDLPTAGPLVDYISVHFYPNQPGADFLNLNQDRLEMLLRYAGGFGRPVVLEEWYPLYPKGTHASEGDWFPHVMQASLANAAGWFTFFFDVLYEIPEDKVVLSRHVRQFQAGAARMRSATLKRAPATITLKIDPDLLWRSKDEVQRLLNEYQRLRRAGQVPDFTVSGQSGR